MPKLKRGQTAFPPPSLNTCHDIRRWTACGRCEVLGHSADMIQSSPDTFWHGRCFVAQFGIERLLELPRKQTQKLTLGDLGVDLMSRLLKSHTS